MYRETTIKPAIGERRAVPVGYQKLDCDSYLIRLNYLVMARLYLCSRILARIIIHSLRVTSSRYII